jgi:hypothetical protein
MDDGSECTREFRSTSSTQPFQILSHFTSLQLFGASAVTKEYVLGVEDYSKATWGQNFIASIAGAVASITVAAPLDTVKTRIQNANFEHKVPGVTVVKELLKNEGPTAFFKGLTPKVCMASVFTSCDEADSYNPRFLSLDPNLCSATRWPSR